MHKEFGNKICTQVNKLLSNIIKGSQESRILRTSFCNPITPAAVKPRNDISPQKIQFEVIRQGARDQGGRIIALLISEM